MRIDNIFANSSIAKILNSQNNSVLPRHCFCTVFSHVTSTELYLYALSMFTHITKNI